MRKNIFTAEDSFARDLLLVFTIIAIVTTVLLSVFRITNGVGPSMLPTLSTSNYSLGIRTHRADRGDIVTLNAPERDFIVDGIAYYTLERPIETKSTSEFLDGDRICIGEGGDLFEIKDYHYYINSAPVDTEYKASVKNMTMTIDEGKRCYLSPYGSYIFAPDTGGNGILKRVVAVPGDHLIIRNSTICINGKAISEPYLSEDNRIFDGDVDLTLGEDEYYVLGDNRKDSNDSRAFGPVKSGSITSRLLVTADDQLSLFLLLLPATIAAAAIVFTIYRIGKTLICKAVTLKNKSCS